MRQIERVAAAALAGVVVSSAAAQDAVQWRVEDGGNGHWYQLQIEDRPTSGWIASRSLASQQGGHLATFSTEAEWAFVTDILLSQPESSLAYLGATQSDECSSGCPSNATWHWIDDTEWNDADWYPWYPGEPSGNGQVAIGRLQSFNGGTQWDDTTDSAPPRGASVIEWSADCNGDGIVDFGQILDGTFADTDGNGVPDCCDADEQCDPCIGDLNDDGVVGPPDLGILLAVWDSDGSIVTGSDINGDGTVNASDLGPLLGAWGVCP
ncbi:hypothetical protein OAG01_00665 [bacterium]|nr:hypothetical protein [bacterium]MDA7668700.1 hypothetical protein [bacterium]MDB4632936.1 hypothetical protein [bacterium]